VYVLRVTDKNGAEVAPHDPVTGEVKP
jgi:hypothetical protein